MVVSNAFSEAISMIEKYNLDSCGFGSFRSGTGGWDGKYLVEPRRRT